MPADVRRQGRPGGRPALMLRDRAHARRRGSHEADGRELGLAPSELGRTGSRSSRRCSSSRAAKWSHVSPAAWTRTSSSQPCARRSSVRAPSRMVYGSSRRRRVQHSRPCARCCVRAPARACGSCRTALSCACSRRTPATPRRRDAAPCPPCAGRSTRDRSLGPCRRRPRARPDRMSRSARARNRWPGCRSRGSGRARGARRRATLAPRARVRSDSSAVSPGPARQQVRDRRPWVHDRRPARPPLPLADPCRLSESPPAVRDRSARKPGALNYTAANKWPSSASAASAEMSDHTRSRDAPAAEAPRLRAARKSSGLLASPLDLVFLPRSSANKAP